MIKEKLFLKCDYTTEGNINDLLRKTIYNTNVDESDLFLWRCQAFEKICMEYIMNARI